jgi:hypothetical protein
MGLTRQSVVDGPGTVTFGSLKLHAQEGISAPITLDRWRTKISTHGEGGLRLRDATGEIKFKPTGRITAGILSALYPAALRNPVINSSLHGSGDTAGIVHSTAGTKVTFKSVGLAALPELILTPQETVMGDVTLSALIGNGLDRTASDSFMVVESAAWSELFPESEIVTVPYSGAWNDITIHTEKGWRVTFDLQRETRYVDGVGTIDHKFKNLIVRASCQPVNLDEDDLFGNLRPQGLALGASMRRSKNLVITGAAGGLVVTLYDATLVEGPCQWGPNTLRPGELGFEASRLISGGTLAALFDITIAS